MAFDASRDLPDEVTNVEDCRADLRLATLLPDDMASNSNIWIGLPLVDWSLIFSALGGHNDAVMHGGGRSKATLSTLQVFPVEVEATIASFSSTKDTVAFVSLHKQFLVSEGDWHQRLRMCTESMGSTLSRSTSHQELASSVWLNVLGFPSTAFDASNNAPDLATNVED